jgi:hypothetical protein
MISGMMMVLLEMKMILIRNLDDFDIDEAFDRLT